MKKLFNLCVMIGVILFAMSANGATTLYVDDDNVCGGNSPCYLHPQDAVNAANPSDTILVYPGSYGSRCFTTPVPPHWGPGDQCAPALIVFKDGLTIQAVDRDPSETTIETTHNFWSNKAMGSGGGGAIEHSTGCTYSGGVWVGECVRPTFGTAPNGVAVIANNSTIDGFTVKSTYGGDPKCPGQYPNTGGILIGGLYSGEATRSGTSGTTIRSCVVRGYSGIRLWKAPNTTLENNIIDNNIPPITPTPPFYSWCQQTGPTPPQSAIDVWDGWLEGPNVGSSDLDILNNQITSYKVASGISLGGYYDGQVDHSNLYIDGNTITSNGHGVTFWGSGGTNKVMTCNNTITVPTGYSQVGVWWGTYDGSFGIGNCGPITLNLIAAPVPIGSDGLVTATIDDSTTGAATIASAEYTLDGGSWVQMLALDGNFDEIVEDVKATISASSLQIGVHEICARGTDFYGNVGPEECILLAVYDPAAGFVTGGGWIDSLAGSMPKLSNPFFNGFETDTTGWLVFGNETIQRVSSSSNGIVSATGAYHAEVTGDASDNYYGPFTRWDGYHSTFPAGGYITTIDVYLDVSGGYINDARFEWSSAINQPGGDHRRDFVFNAGFYNDNTGPGAGTNRFVISASNNATRSGAYPKNPGRDPIAITASGWYTFQHRFYDNGNGVLAVDLSIYDSSGNLVHKWTLSDPTDIIGTTVGGNRYGWLVIVELPFLAIDNTARQEYPVGKANFGFVSKYQKGASVPTGNTEFVFKAGNLNFHSSSYEWLVVTGSNYARFKGVGTINGAGEYKFMLWAGDGTGTNGADTFRIKIWYEDDDVETVVYDNGMDQAIGGGNIVVHTK